MRTTSDGPLAHTHTRRRPIQGPIGTHRPPMHCGEGMAPAVCAVSASTLTPPLPRPSSSCLLQRRRCGGGGCYPCSTGSSIRRLVVSTARLHVSVGANYQRGLELKRRPKMWNRRCSRGRPTEENPTEPPICAQEPLPQRQASPAGWNHSSPPPSSVCDRPGLVPLMEGESSAGIDPITSPHPAAASSHSERQVSCFSPRRAAAILPDLCMQHSTRPTSHSIRTARPPFAYATQRRHTQKESRVFQDTKANRSSG